jgi:hypothetical protein
LVTTTIFGPRGVLLRAMRLQRRGARTGGDRSAGPGDLNFQQLVVDFQYARTRALPSSGPSPCASFSRRASLVNYLTRRRPTIRLKAGPVSATSVQASRGRSSQPIRPR